MDIQQLIIIRDDGFVAVNDRGFLGLDMSSIDPQIHSLHWYGSVGDMVLRPDGPRQPQANIEVRDLALFQDVLTAWLEAAEAEDNPPPPPLEEVAWLKVAELSGACEAAIVSGFESAALGTTHRYQSDRDDQTNLLGAVSTGTEQPFKCGAIDGANIDWAYRLHSAEQLLQVLRDGAVVKQALLQRFNTLKQRVEAISADTQKTEEQRRQEIAAVAWQPF